MFDSPTMAISRFGLLALGLRISKVSCQIGLQSGFITVHPQGFTALWRVHRFVE